MAKAVEDELQLTASSPEQRRRYDLLMAGLDLLDQAIAVFDASPRLVTWNKALLRLLDFPESLVRVGTPFEAFVRFNAERGEYGEGDIEKLVAARMASARAFEPHYVERVRPNGRVLAVRGVPIPNLGFVSLWTDVTEQRRAEALIQEQNARLEARVRERTAELEKANREIDQIAEALRLSEGRMRLILDAIPAMIAHVDAGRRYRFANRAYAEWFGLTRRASSAAPSSKCSATMPTPRSNPISRTPRTASASVTSTHAGMPRAGWSMHAARSCPTCRSKAAFAAIS